MKGAASALLPRAKVTVSVKMGPYGMHTLIHIPTPFSPTPAPGPATHRCCRGDANGPQMRGMGSRRARSRWTWRRWTRLRWLRTRRARSRWTWRRWTRLRWLRTQRARSRWTSARRIQSPRAVLLVTLGAFTLMPSATCLAQWPPDAETAGRGGAAGARVGHHSPHRPAPLPDVGTGIELARAVPLGVSALATSSVRAWHARGQWTGSLGVDVQSFDAWSALRPHVSISTRLHGLDSGLRLGATVAAEREKLGLLGHRTTPLLVVGARAVLMKRVHLSAHGINSRAAARQGARAAVQVSVACEGCPLIGHAAWNLHPHEGSLWSAGGEWMLSRWLSIGMGAQSVPLAMGFAVRVRAPGNVAARVAALSHHNTAPTHAFSLRATGRLGKTEE